MLSNYSIPITAVLTGKLNLAGNYPQLLSDDMDNFIALTGLPDLSLCLTNGSRVQVKGALSFDHLDRATLNVYSIAKL